jgi:hypothetical protein
VRTRSTLADERENRVRKRRESAFAPRGVPHVYRVESDGARWLALASPAGFETFVREVAGADGELGPAELTGIAARYGIEILGPPGTLPAGT